MGLVSKLNGRSADCHYKFAKILEKIAPYQFYLRYFHMKQSGNIMEAIPLLTVHCMENENYGVEDLQSANGTKINGYSIQTGMVYELHEGDVITLADDSFTVSYVVTPDFYVYLKG